MATIKIKQIKSKIGYPEIRSVRSRPWVFTRSHRS